MEEKRKRRLSKFLEVRLVSSYLYSKRAWKVLFCSQTFGNGIVDDYFFFLSFTPLSRVLKSCHFETKSFDIKGGGKNNEKLCKIAEEVRKYV